MNAVVKDEWAGFPPAPVIPASPLAQALAQAQGEFEPIRRERMVKVQMKSGGSYTFAYAPLEAILRAVAPALTKHGLALTQSVDDGSVETVLMHASGQKISNRIKIMVKEEGPQAYGSGLTYARRYGVTLLLCVCADEDDDGNAAEGNSTQAQKGHDPRGEAISRVSLDDARNAAMGMRAILEEDTDEHVKALHVLDKHDALVKNDDLYIAASDQLSAKERSAWKTFVAMGKARQNAEPRPNGRR